MARINEINEMQLSSKIHKHAIWLNYVLPRAWGALACADIAARVAELPDPDVRKAVDSAIVSPASLINAATSAVLSGRRVDRERAEAIASRKVWLQNCGVREAEAQYQAELLPCHHGTVGAKVAYTLCMQCVDEYHAQEIAHQ